MQADLPPSSSDTRAMFGAEAWRIEVPVPVSPVKEIFATRGSVTRALPTSAPGPGSTETASSGTPASTSSSPSIRAVSGVYDAGLRTTALPAASAGATFHVAIISGKFQGTIRALTPTGSRSTTPSPGAEMGATSPCTLSAAPPKYSRVAAAASTTSHRASPMGLPALRASTRARSSLRSRMSAAARNSTRPRSVAGRRGHGPSSKARVAAARASSTSAGPALATVAIGVPVAGSFTEKVSPDREGRRRPPISSSWVVVSLMAPALVASLVASCPPRSAGPGDPSERPARSRSPTGRRREVP